MKFSTQVFWLLFSPSVLTSPVQIDLNVHVDSHDTTDSDAKKSPLAQLATSTTSSTLPRVNLGYQIIQASKDKKEGQTYYAFENIPYAKQPVGPLRFVAAQPYTYQDNEDDPDVNDGTKDVVCPQVQPGWFGFTANFTGQLFNPVASLDPIFEKPIEPEQYPPLDEGLPNQTEECLVLDVFVPKRLYDDGEAAAPVLVSFHGGGFVYGSKSISPEGILKAAEGKDSNDELIIVNVNYRLGALGWLGGKKFREAGGLENAGLSDQNVALQWVASKIPQFGGSSQITVMGESAGASSILHHLTAWGGDLRGRPRPKFNKAILQSPAFFPQTDERKMDQVYDAFLKATGAKDFADLQKATSTEKLIQANRETVYYSPYGTFTYGPTVTRDYFFTKRPYVLFPPALKMRYESWYNDIPLMIANNGREGAVFTPPWLRNEKDLANYIKYIYPEMSDKSLKEFAKLYPVPQQKMNSAGKIVDTTGKERFSYAATAFGDIGSDCNVWQLKKSVHRDQSYEYFYQLYPGFHGQDVGATWYPNADERLTSFNPKGQSERLQRWLTCFAKTPEGHPNCANTADDEEFKDMDSGTMWIGTGNLAFPSKPDLAHGMSKAAGDLPSDEVCNFWNEAPYLPDEPDDVARTLRVQNGRANEL